MASSKTYSRLVIYRGSTLRRRMVYRISGGAGIPITEAVLTITPDGGAVISCTQGNGKLLLVDGPNGVLELVISAAETSTYAWVNGTHRLTLTLGNGDIKVVIRDLPVAVR